MFTKLITLSALATAALAQGVQLQWYTTNDCSNAVGGSIALSQTTCPVTPDSAQSYRIVVSSNYMEPDNTCRVHAYESPNCFGPEILPPIEPTPGLVSGCVTPSTKGPYGAFIGCDL
ncbi:hypothetical protein K488DRAFT_82856 [Vararia minispora EC-137]|uniref:Uncharacterized protein n=1 Tax=Vararia minispora EC-137 TaxID=1314806 RepID=A0ACB8QV13_9AGAM|nr:hypothetical protein K488DRAFT_82856 [Vararia minispora EC-137]